MLATDNKDAEQWFIIRNRNGPIRRLLWPMYSLDQTVCTLSLIASIGVIVFSLDRDATIYVIVGTTIVTWISAYRHAPVCVLLPRPAYAAAVRVLDRHWRRSDRDNCWVPRATRWRRWSHVMICLLDNKEQGFTIEGPCSNVTSLVSDLKEYFT